MEHNLSYGITQCYPPPNTGECAPHLPHVSRLILDLPTPERWKAELTLVLAILRCVTCPQTVTHPTSNHLIATRLGVEPTTSRSQVQRPDRYTTKPPVYGLMIIVHVMFSTMCCKNYR